MIRWKRRRRRRIRRKTITWAGRWGGRQAGREAGKQASAEVAITYTGQRNHQPKCAAVCVLLAAKKRAHSASDVTWACVWCLVSCNITQK